MNQPIPIKPEAAPADADRYFRLGDNMLKQLRAELLEANLAWHRRRAELVDRARDELARIDGEHNERIEKLRANIARLEGMR